MHQKFGMNHKKPYHRIYRPVKEDCINSSYSDWAYITDKDYAQNPEHYVRAFSIIQDDVFKLFEFIEPSDSNLKTHSFRIHELLMRLCMEIESNFKAILKENIYTPLDSKNKLRLENSWNFRDYMIINRTHHLDGFKIQFPIWKGTEGVFQPFKSLKTNDTPSWWSAYNKSKHDRYNNFEYANFENLMNAYSGLCILLSSQFRTENFKPGPRYLTEHGYCYYGGGFGIGDYLIVDFSEDWQEEELYDFDWSKLKKESVRFERFDYNKIFES